MKIDSPILKAAIEASARGSQIAIEHFQKYESLENILKEDKSVVTKADIECQEAIISILQRRFPKATVIAEESQEKVEQSDEVWIVDPIDGTKEFSRGIHTWAILVAYAREGEIIAGTSFFPMLGDLYYAEKGKGAFCNDNAVRVSRISEFPHTFLSFSPLKYFNESEERALLSVAKKINGTRSMVASQAGALVASSKMDCYIASHNNHIWDNAPFAVIIPEAGGKVTDWNNKALNIYRKESPVVMSNGILHEKVLSLLAENL